MDLELVLTTILTWMKYRVEDAAPWVQWAGAGYAVYLFVRGNWIVLRDLARGVCYAGAKGYRGAVAFNAWRRRPSRYARLEARLNQLQADLGGEPQEAAPLTNVASAASAERQAELDARLAQVASQTRRSKTNGTVLDGGTTRGPTEPIYVGTAPLNRGTPPK